MSDSAPASAPAPEPASAPVAADPQDMITVGQQIAGGLLIGNAILVLLSAFLIPADPKLGPMFEPSRSFIPVLERSASGPTAYNLASLEIEA
jgi:hypothetical protein